MKKDILILVLVLVGISLGACMEIFAPEESDNKTPDWLDELVIEYYEGGGMLPKSQQIYISLDSAYNEIYDFGNKTRVTWKPNRDDLNALYKTLKANNFNRIKSDTYPGEVSDRGGPIIEIHIDGKHYELNNNGNSFIRQQWREEFYAIEKAILDYAKTEQ